jgi:hypothetical protein
MATLPLSDIVNVSVNVGPVAAVRTNFNLGLIVGQSSIISTIIRVKTYSKLSDMTADGWTGNEPEYLAAQIYLSQSPQPNKVAIGRWQPPETSVAAVTACRNANAEWYVCTVCGVASADIQAVAQYIEAASPSSVYFYTTHDPNILTGTSGNIMDILSKNSIHRTLGQFSTNNIQASGYEVGGSGAATDIHSGTANEFQIAVDGDATSHTVTLTLANCTSGSAIAAEIQKQINSIGGSVYSNVTVEYSVDHYVISSPTNGIGSQIRITAATTNDASAELKIGAANGATDIDGTTTYIEAAAAIMGYAMGANTQSANSAYALFAKPEVGVTAEPLTSAQLTVIKNYKGNAYVNRGSVYNLFENGTMHDGTYFDEVLNLDMLSNNLQTAVINAFIDQDKIPQTDAGMQMLINTLTTPLENAVKIGFIAPGVWDSAPILSVNTGDVLTTGYKILADSIASQSQADRDSRIAPPIYVLIKTAGAMQNVAIQLYENR